MKRWASALLGIACLAGCAHYQLGSTLPPDIKSVYIPVFQNKTGEPDVERETTRAAIQEFQNDGTLRVAPEERADLLLEVTVVEYQMKPIRYERTRTTTAEEFRMRLVADIVARRASDGTVFIARKGLEGDTTFPIATDMRSAKLEALPDAAADLAHEIVEALVEAW